MIELITLKELENAIIYTLESTPKEEAKILAEYFLDFFGYGDRIIDNILTPKDRDAFYMLEDSGLLTTDREETNLYDGREWRINYWLLKKDEIKKASEDYKAKKRAELEPEIETEAPCNYDEYWEQIEKVKKEAEEEDTLSNSPETNIENKIEAPP